MLNNFQSKFKVESLAIILLVFTVIFSQPVLAADSNTVTGPTPLEIKEAERGDVTAQVNLAVIYYDNKNFNEAVKWFTKAAEKGNAVAQYNLGNMYADGVGGLKKDNEEALKWYKKSAEQGYGFAQNNVGIAYKNGQGVKQDQVEAVKWFTRAADQDVSVSQNMLGAIYAKGEEGIPQDYTKSVEWYTKAADNNDAYAQFNLGQLYANGQGVKKDIVQAYFYVSLAAAQNKKYAIDKLEVLQELMTPAQLTEAKALAQNWKPKNTAKP